LLGVFAGLSLAVISAAPVVPSPAHPGAWHKAGAAVASARSGQALHFNRTVLSPKALGVVARSSSARPMKVFWFSYCEFASDDDIMEQHQGTARGVGTVTVYPPVFDGATRCTVSVNVTPAKNAKAAAAVFAY
jgi:hypothetical protein